MLRRRSSPTPSSRSRTHCGHWHALTNLCAREPTDSSRSGHKPNKQQGSPIRRCSVLMGHGPIADRGSSTFEIGSLAGKCDLADAPPGSLLLGSPGGRMTMSSGKIALSFSSAMTFVPRAAAAAMSILWRGQS